MCVNSGKKGGSGKLFLKTSRKGEPVFQSQRYGPRTRPTQERMEGMEGRQEEQWTAKKTNT